jgi:hypothetical protein
MPVLEMIRDQIMRIEEVAPVHIALQKALRATPIHTLEQLTEPVPGAGSDKPNAPRQFREIKPVLTRLTGAKARVVLASLDAYRETLPCS